jgi:hypothetical protein
VSAAVAMKNYLDESQLSIKEAIKKLPGLGKCTQIYAQISGAEGQNVSQADTNSEWKKQYKTIDNGEVCHALAGEDAKGELERAKGFEPSTLTLAT